MHQQLYLTFKKETYRTEDANGNNVWLEDFPLGFGSVYNPNGKSFEKRKLIQDSWFQDYGPWQQIDGVWYTGKWGEWNRETQCRNHVIFDTKPYKYQPKIIGNFPMTGFTLYSFTSRHSTDNKWIRILDPRGFQLEISVANLIELAGTTTIVKGNFKEPLIWDFGKNGVGKARLIRGD